MKSKLLIIALTLMIVGVLGIVPASGQTIFRDNGTITIKFDLNLASGGVTGTDHAFPQAVKTGWASVPTGVPFTIYVESQDADSTAAFGPDSVHIGVETTPSHSLADLNPTSYYTRPMLLWTKGGPKFSIWSGTGAAVVASRIGPQAHYFVNAPGDTSFGTVTAAVAAKDSAAWGAASNKSYFAGDYSGGGLRVQNMGRMRFSLCMGDDDSTADAAINMDCYIIFREDSPSKIHGSLEILPDVIHGGTFRDPAEYAEFREGVFYGSHWVQLPDFDDKQYPARSLR